jgi:hypothetical protein
MQESTEPPVTKPAAGEAQRDPSNTALPENQTSAPQNPVPANFVEIFQIPRPASPDKDEPPAEEMEEETWDEIDDEPDEERISPIEQQIEDLVTRYQQKQETPKKEPLPSEITHAELRKNVEHAGGTRIDELMSKWLKEKAEEARLEKLAQALASEQNRVTNEDSVDEEDAEEDEGEFAEEEPSKEQSEPEPDQIIGIKTGGHPAKTTGLDMEDLIRQDGVIKKAQFVSPEDGVINQVCRAVSLRSDRNSLYEPLFESLILPSGVQQFRTTRALFDDISSLLNKQITLPTKDCSLLVYWAIATWFTEDLAFVPTVVISGPASIADILLRTLVAVCRRTLLLGELSPAIFRKLPIYPIRPTLLVRESQLNRNMSSLLNASNQPGYLFLSTNTFQQLYCPKCIYVGECVKDSPAASNSVHINLSGSALQPDYSLPTEDEITSFQNRLFSYRLLNHRQVASASYTSPGLRPEISAVAGELAAAIVDDVDLQDGVIEALKGSDEQARVDRATGVNGLVVRAVLFHCHQNDQRRFVRECSHDEPTLR